MNDPIFGTGLGFSLNAYKIGIIILYFNTIIPPDMAGYRTLIILYTDLNESPRWCSCKVRLALLDDKI